ncbi:MAG: PEP-CTERM sorting domain-containing protein, partial [Planctomycetota bacterium]
VEGEFDSVLGWFDDVTGELLEDDDDGGEDLLSVIVGDVPASGEVVLAVSGFDDFDFIGEHAESGTYTLTLTEIPEPGSIALVVLGLLQTGRRRHG